MKEKILTKKVADNEIEITDNNFKNVLAKRLKHLRKVNSLTQIELENKTGISVRQISRIENGEVSTIRQDDITLLSDCFNVPPEYFIDSSFIPIYEDMNIPISEYLNNLIDEKKDDEDYALFNSAYKMLSSIYDIDFIVIPDINCDDNTYTAVTLKYDSIKYLIDNFLIVEINNKIYKASCVNVIIKSPKDNHQICEIKDICIFNYLVSDLLSYMNNVFLNSDKIKNIEHLINTRSFINEFTDVEFDTQK